MVVDCGKYAKYFVLKTQSFQMSQNMTQNGWINLLKPSGNFTYDQV
jgi:hypothetical protein